MGGLRGAVFNRQRNLPQHRIKIIHNLIIPKTQHPVAVFHEKYRPLRIIQSLIKVL